MPRYDAIDYTLLSYVALRDLKVNGVVRTAGSAIPEAALFKNLTHYISQGQIMVVQPHVNHPQAPSSVSAKASKTGKAEGNAEYTHYRPADHTGLPALIANDAS